MRAPSTSGLPHGQRGASVVRLLRRPWEYATSAPLELVTAVTDDGREHDLVLKHLGPRHVTEQVRRAKPSFVVDSRREIEVYRRLLAPLRIGPALVGSRIAPETDTYWLLLEHVRGPRLFEVGAPAAWAATAHWLGAFHCAPGHDRPRGCAARRRAHRVSARLVPHLDRPGATVLRRRWSIVVPS